MTDIRNPRFIYLKGVLFAFIIMGCVLLLFLNNPKYQTIVLALILVWASARLYYFMFYVIEKYIDNEYRFSGVYSFIKYLLKTK